MANLNFLWPTIDDLDDAKKAAHQGAASAFLVSIVTGVVTILSLQGVKFFEGMTDASSFLDAGLFLFIGFFIYRFSRIAAVAGLLLYVGEQIMTIKMTGYRFSFIPILLTCYFISGVRGTFDYHHMKKLDAPEVKAPPPPQVFPQERDVPKKKPVLLWAVVLVFLAAAAFCAWYFLSHQKTQPVSSPLNAASETRKEVPNTPASSPKLAPALPSRVGETTFKMKDGRSITGRVLIEDDVYYTVETSGGREEIVIKEDISQS